MSPALCVSLCMRLCVCVCARLQQASLMLRKNWEIHRWLRSTLDWFALRSYSNWNTALNNAEQLRKNAFSKRSKWLPFYPCADIFPNYLCDFQTDDCQERKCKVTPTSRPTHVLHCWSQRLLAKSASDLASSFWHSRLSVLGILILISGFIYIILPTTGLSLMKGVNAFL